MPTIKQIKHINKIKFPKIILDKNIQIFLIYIISFKQSLKLIYLAKQTWIILLFIKKIKIFAKYFKFLIFFLKKNFVIFKKNQA